MHTQYDPKVCFMEYPDGNWLWIQSSSYCSPLATSSSSLSCTWNLAQGWENTKTPIPVPKGFSPIDTYTCDNQLYSLPWPDFRTGNFPNRYNCACGQPLLDTVNCTGRCDIPWTASFGKRCNVVTNTITKGNFSNYGGNQGTCLSVAGQRNVQVGQDSQNPIDVVNQATLKASDVLVIDGFGLTQVCSTENADRGNGRICNCEGALPETAWGQTVANRDACELEKSPTKAWIAGPVLGGVALLCLIALLVGSRRKILRVFRSGVKLEDQQAIALEDLGHLNDRTTVGELVRESPPGQQELQETPSTTSEISQESFDSGVALIRPNDKQIASSSRL